MRRIANTAELQTELHRVLAYVQTEHPARKRIATELLDLAHRTAATGGFFDRLDALAKSVIASVRAKEKVLSEGDLEEARYLASKLRHAAASMDFLNRANPEILYQMIQAVRTTLK